MMPDFRCRNCVPYDRGEITPEEYERTRTHVIAKVKASFDKPRKKAAPDLTTDDDPGE